MAEWVPPHHARLSPPPPPPPLAGVLDDKADPPAAAHIHSTDHQLPPPPPDAAGLRSGTYIVQVPKDQIYRVPPPENAHYAERLGRTGPRRNPCSACFSGLFGVLLLVFLILAIIGTALFIAIRPRLPSFSVQKLVVKNIPGGANSRRHLKPTYEFTIQSRNPNPVMDIYYPTRGRSTLSHKRTAIAAGKTPTLEQDHGETKSFHLLLAGTGTRLPPDLKKSMTVNKGKRVPVDLALSVRMPVRLKVGSLTLWAMQLSVNCDVTASTLAKGTKIKSQNCHAKLH